MKIPIGRPVPPANATPPRITAVSTSNSNDSPVLPEPEPICAVVSTATRPTASPFNANSATTCRSTLTPLRRAASRLPPIAYVRMPPTVRTSRKPPTAKNASAIQTGSASPSGMRAADARERRRQVEDRAAVRHHVRQPAVDRQQPERHDQRRDAQPAHEQPVDEAQREPHRQPRRDRHESALRVARDDRRDDGDERVHPANREVDVARDHQRAGRDADDQHRRRVEQDRLEVVDRGEAAASPLEEGDERDGQPRQAEPPRVAAEARRSHVPATTVR